MPRRKPPLRDFRAPVEAREVHGAGRHLLLGDGDAVLGEPARHVPAAAGAGDHHVGEHLRAVAQSHPPDLERGTCPWAVGHQPVDADADPEPHALLGQHAAAEHPLEGGAAAAQHLQVLGVAGVVGVVGGDRRRQDAELADACVAQGEPHCDYVCNG